MQLSSSLGNAAFILEELAFSLNLCCPGAAGDVRACMQPGI